MCVTVPKILNDTDTDTDTLFPVPSIFDTDTGTFFSTNFFRYRFRDFFPVPIFSDTGSDNTKKMTGIPGTGTSHSAVQCIV